MSTTTQIPDHSLLALTANVMQKAGAAGAVSPEGFLLVNSSMNPIYVTPEVAQILIYPNKVEAHRNNLGDHIAKKLRSLSFLEQSSGTSISVVARFQSGKRQYLCRAFQVRGLDKRDSQALVALLFERSYMKPMFLAGISDKFHLSTREREVAQHLLQGLTSKEIGKRMQISPHTVKGFIRLIMFKMGVSTRSGIVVKALTPES